jgi:hypothetical protein
MSSNAYNTFTGLTKYVHQLETIHGNLADGRGRRHGQDALHRAGVVLAVAAWESYVEALVLEAFESIRPPVGASQDAILMHSLALTRANQESKGLNTPNAENVRKLFQSTLGFDVVTHWNWTAPHRHWSYGQMMARLNEWIKVRHSVAHGGSLPNLDMLKNSHGSYTLRLNHLKACREFMMHIAGQCDTSLSLFLTNTYGIARPW